MSSTTKNIPPRLEELMVDAATQGLSPQDEAELQAAIASDPSLRDEAEAYELAATAVELSLAPAPMEDLPPALRDKLIASAGMHASGNRQSLKLSGSPADKPDTPSPFSFTDGRMFGWYAAIAALVALAFVLVLEPKAPQATTDPDPDTLAQQYEALAGEADTVAASWAFNVGDENNPGGDAAYADTTGEVIWNNDSQTGYMKLAGLPVNNPAKLQYQLWIVDASRSTDIENTNRVDGGVFDITAEGEVIVPINAKLVARDAAAFAITVETPGGVVESKGPLQLLAVVDKG